MKDFEFREFNINAKNNDKNMITLEIDTRQSKRFSKENRFLTESIAPDVFIRGIKKDALILLNHDLGFYFRMGVTSNRWRGYWFCYYFLRNL